MVSGIISETRTIITYKAALKYRRCLNMENVIQIYNFITITKVMQFIRSSLDGKYTIKKEEIPESVIRNLTNDEIKDKPQKRKGLNKELSNCLWTLNDSTTWMKMQIIKYSINCYINKQIAKIKQRQVKKTRWFNCRENIQDGLQNIPSNLISNLTGKSYTEIV